MVENGPKDKTEAGRLAESSLSLSRQHDGGLDWKKDSRPRHLLMFRAGCGTTVVGTVLDILGWLTASLASIHKRPVALSTDHDNQKVLQTWPNVLQGIRTLDYGDE